MNRFRMATSLFDILPIIVITILPILSYCQCDHNSLSRKHVALFIFGDTLYDVGNNNYINTTFDYQANYTPYGMTFFKSPTGRFSDGRLVSDFIAEFAMLPFIYPYLNSSFEQYENGVNFASAGAGALIETHGGLVIDLRTQLRYFDTVEKRLIKKLGAAKSVMILSNAVYLLSIGSNDYLSLFFSNSNMLQFYSKQEYVEMIISNVTMVVTEIYKKGGRKFGFLNVPPLHILPSVRQLHSKLKGTGTVKADLETLEKLHNIALNRALSVSSHTLNGLKYSSTKLYSATMERINAPSKYGFSRVDKACCGTGPFRGVFSCGGKRTTEHYAVCDDPSEFLFFDSYHFSEKANYQIAKLMWDGSSIFTKPHNLKSLFESDSNVDSYIQV